LAQNVRFISKSGHSLIRLACRLGPIADIETNLVCHLFDHLIGTGEQRLRQLVLLTERSKRVCSTFLTKVPFKLVTFAPEAFRVGAALQYNEHHNQ
jgi:hypothetical protein